MLTFHRITFDKNIMGGRACIRGMRVTASHILNLLANGQNADDILAEYPDLEGEDIQEVLYYMAWLAKDEIHTLEEYAA
ncbi:MAG: DUF433 domain-containing protein [Pseudomonadota bacterium]